jgi:hypothetical protein
VDHVHAGTLGGRVFAHGIADITLSHSFSFIPVQIYTISVTMKYAWLSAVVTDCGTKKTAGDWKQQNLVHVCVYICGKLL